MFTTINSTKYCLGACPCPKQCSILLLPPVQHRARCFYVGIPSPSYIKFIFEKKKTSDLRVNKKREEPTERKEDGDRGTRQAPGGMVSIIINEYSTQQPKFY